MTAIAQMVNDGIALKYLALGYHKNRQGHIFVIATTNEGRIYLDFSSNNGKPIEEMTVNGRMEMNNSGIYNWIED